jgi:hypothetical protein
VANVRGVIVLNAVRFVKERHGDDAHQEVVAALPGEPRRTFLSTLRDAAWTPAAHLAAYLETAQRLLAPDNPLFCRELGRFAGRLERAKQGFEPLVVDPLTAMRMAPVTWRSFWSAGHIQVFRRGPLEAIARIHGFAVSPVLCERSCGAWEALVSSEELSAAAREAVCVHRGGAFCEIHVTWGPRVEKG